MNWHYKFLFGGLLSALSLSAPAAATQQLLSGHPAIVDGDTLDFDGARVRLAGIDAPEAAQVCIRNETDWNCGKAATALLTQLIGDHEVICRGSVSDRYGRLVAQCSRRGLDLGLTMIEAGLAVTVQDSPREYEAAEAIRKEISIGLWESQFDMPSDWRAANRELVPDPAPDPPNSQVRQRPSATAQIYRGASGCLIKGNRNRSGEWIYHLPGRPYYEQTRPEELFCTEADARRAGYRRSKA